MRGDFIVKFLTAIKDISVDVGANLTKVQYKGFKYDDFNIYAHNHNKKYYGFKNLKKRKLIKNIDHEEFMFTRKGQKWLGQSLIRYFRDKRDGEWDGKWRIVIFDIPQEMHKERVRFRKKLKLLGFVMLQKSVFVFPYSCEEEISYVTRNLRINDYVDIIIGESAGFREKEFIKLFDL